MNPTPTLYPVHPLPPKPKRYRANTIGLSREIIARLAKYHEDRSEWRQAAAFWHVISTVQRDACLSIATACEMGDAWRAYRESLPYGDSDGRSLTYRALGFRWLLANDCLHEAQVFATDSDPIRDASFMQLLVEGLDMTPQEDDLLEHVISAAGSLRGVETVDRGWLVAKAVEGLHASGSRAAHFGSLDKAGLVALVEPWVDVSIGLGHTPRECGASRAVVTLDGEGRELSEGAAILVAVSDELGARFPGPCDTLLRMARAVPTCSVAEARTAVHAQFGAPSLRYLSPGLAARLEGDGLHDLAGAR